MTDLLSEDELGVLSTAVSVGHRDSASEHYCVETENTLREALILLHQHKSDESINLLLRLPSEGLTPRESAELHLTLATCYSEQGRAEEACRVAQRHSPRLRELGSVSCLNNSAAHWVRRCRSSTIMRPR
jgi:hypothetical protein